jgi:hypothetical protein
MTTSDCPAVQTELYRPSNGSEGEWFTAAFCSRCDRDKREDRPCTILGRTFAHDIDEPGYPKEWVHDAGKWPGNPRCTAFVERGSVKLSEPSSTIRDKRQIGMQL